MLELTPGKWHGLRRLADAGGRLCMTAVDQRPPIKSLIAQRAGGTASYADVAQAKRLLVDVLQHKSSAMLLDPHYAVPRALPALAPAKGLIVTLEDSQFAAAAGGRRSQAIDDWDVGKIKRLGADAVKALVWYRPDADPDVCAAQQDFARRIGAQCARCDIPFLLELLVYPLGTEAAPQEHYAQMPGVKTEHVLASVAQFAAAEYQVDVFKLESPLPADQVPAPGAPGWDAALATFVELGRLAGRPWVMLSAGAAKAQFANVLECACRAGASGYLAGRAIWLDALGHYPDWGKVERLLRQDALPYMERLNAITAQHALPWHAHPGYGSAGARLAPADQTFRHRYESL